MVIGSAGQRAPPLPTQRAETAMGYPSRADRVEQPSGGVQHPARTWSYLSPEVWEAAQRARRDFREQVTQGARATVGSCANRFHTTPLR